MNGNDSNQGQQRKQYQYIPVNDTEYMSRVTEPGWGKTEEIPRSLDDDLKRRVYYEDEKGNVSFVKTSVWAILGIFTRDIRLGNLSELNNELQRTRYYLKFTADLLMEGVIESSVVTLGEAVVILETSQSKNGFMRKQSSTITNEQHYEEKGKKSLFDLGRKQ
jgi:hypothetical protein